MSTEPLPDASDPVRARLMSTNIRHDEWMIREIHKSDNPMALADALVQLSPYVEPWRALIAIQQVMKAYNDEQHA